MSADDDAPPVRRKGHRRLSGEEQVLWQAVARSVTPLRRRLRAEVLIPESLEIPAASPAPRRAAIKLEPLSIPQPPKPAIPALETLARRDRKRIASGRHSIDARIDLHGRTQAQAHSALIAFIGRSRAQGARTVLVITGKGGSDAGSGRGVLKRQVPMWLSMPELRASVIGFEPAASMHGGEGALYVRLRRAEVF